ncbi:MAG: class I SAM-dependent methyltransferase [Candidatus Omnitrophica bacterium]|nr:class I SAM-dependent methyltransferase [Candidatus Omnitrophota bacterium]
MRRTTPFTSRCLRKYYPGTPTDYEHFSNKTNNSLPTRGRILDLGAGAGIIPTLDWRGPSRTVFGVDPDPRLGVNKLLDRAAVGDGTHLPFADSVFDSAVSVNVMEHLPAPDWLLKEALRVLKPGARLFVKTPNRNHYIGWIARLTPTGFHKWYNRLRGREAEDTFETHYRYNRFQDVERIARSAGFEVESLDAFEGIPEYLLLAAPLFFPGLWYERWVNARPGRNRYRANLEIVLRKPSN